MIVAENLTKYYGEQRAVDDLSFTVQPGVVTGFLGPNGSGKSTTMRLILELDAPSSGDVTVNGKRSRDHPAPLHEVGRCSRRAPFTPVAPRTTTCSRWRRRTGSAAGASTS
jgi:ABC-type multidrug transport system ATPase subunit